MNLQGKSMTSSRKGPRLVTGNAAGESVSGASGNMRGANT